MKNIIRRIDAGRHRPRRAVDRLVDGVPAALLTGTSRSRWSSAPLFLWPYVAGLQYLVFMAFGVPQFAWRYVGLREVRQILGASAIPAAILAVMRLVAGGNAG